MIRVIVSGKSGQVVSALREMREPGVTIIPVGRPEMDLTDARSVARTIETARPDLVVSAAAFTAVDKAEREADLAFAVNGGGAEAVAVTAARLGVPLIHLSTDYVFGGTKSGPYVESDPINPVSVYGASKAAGEDAVRRAADDHVILRTAWVHSPFGANFVKTILRLAAERPVLRIVDDQHGTPTAASHIAGAVIAVARRLVEARDEPGLRGTFHLTSGGETTWAGFAAEILSQLPGATAVIERITTAEYPTPAQRPANSRLATGKLAAIYGIALPDWREGVAESVRRLRPSAEKAA
jgi:dTDP-4-dehydrorhamnose reductase